MLCCSDKSPCRNWKWILTPAERVIIAIERARSRRNYKVEAKSAVGSRASVKPTAAELQMLAESVARTLRGISPMRGIVVGITGGVASGKTTFAEILRRGGAAYYSVDATAHALYRRGLPAYRRIVAAFGRRVVDRRTGEIDRSRLGGIVFADEKARHRLEAIVHPLLRRTVARAVKRLRLSQALTAVEAGPLLFALGLDRFVDVVVVIRCGRSGRIKRLRSLGRSSAEARRRIDAFSALDGGLVARAQRSGRSIVLAGDGPVSRLDAVATALLRGALLRWG